MNLQVYSYTGPTGAADTTVNDNTNFRSKLANAPLIIPGTAKRTARADGQEPAISGVILKGQDLVINFMCLQNPVGDGYDALAALFNQQDKTTKTLILKDSDDSDRQWYVTGRNLGLGESMGRNVQAFMALDSMVPLTVNTQTESTWVISSLPATQAFNINVGNIEALPIFDFSPSSAGSSGQRYKRFCTTYNYTSRAAVAYHIDMTNGGLDTTALINFTAISLQVNNGAGYNSSATTIAYDTVVGTLPAVPFLLYRGGEQMRVTARTGTTSGNLTVVRGLYGSVATSHGDNVVLALSKIAFNGSDVRVKSGDGNGSLTEIPYQFGTGANAMNQTNTKIWIPINYAARAIGTLYSSITNSDVVLLLSPTEGYIDQTDGILLAESEIITYTNYDPAISTATGLIRGAKGSTAAAHTAGITVRAINELWLFYGDPSATAPTYSTALNVPFDLTSTNSSWVYSQFASSAANTADEWKPIKSGAAAYVYSSDRDPWNSAPADPVVEIGVSIVARNTYAYWQLAHPFGYLTATAANVDRQNLPAAQGFLVSDDGTRTVIAQNPSATWATTASLVHTPSTGRGYWVQLYLKNTQTAPYPARAAINIAAVTMALATDTTSASYGVPYVSLGSEQVVTYDLDGTLTNNTTAESIRIKFPDIGSGETLRVNTLLKTITYLKDNTRAYNALQNYPARENWLRMIQGSNTLAFTANNFNVIVRWQGRNNSIG